MSENALPMWVVYDHPSDYPEVFVARRHLVDGDGDRPTSDMFTSTNIEDLRSQLAGFGLVCVARSEQDNPVIVETWV